MNKKNIRAILPPLISLIASAAAGAGMIYLYGITKYLPLYLLGLLILLPSGVNISLLLLKIQIKSKDRKPVLSEEEAAAPPKGIKRILTAIGRFFSGIAHKIGAHGVMKAIRYLSYFIAAASFIVIQYFFAISLKASTSLYTTSYAYAVLLIALFLVFIVLDKWILHNENANEYAVALGGNVRSILALARLALILIIPATFIKLLGFYELQKYVVIAIAIVFYWTSLITLLSYVARAIRHELASCPDIRIPTLFSGGSGHDMGILSYLEENTGITMRGLWSVKLMGKLIAPSLIAIFLLFWISTGIVEIGSGQAGALYNFGRLANEPLDPGIHLTLPWPFGKTVIYNTEEVSSITIGYRSDTSSDNVWTQTHGSEEYELLLGGGEELVSINLCIEYRIDDLNEYLINCANPVAILEACAYELVADKTIVTDLNTLLSVDREAFATDFKNDLVEKIDDRNTGLEIVSVVLESIHPPLGIADIYQRLVSAEIEAQTRIMYAQTVASVRVCEAESNYNSTVSTATAEKLNKIAAAEAEVAEFMASVAADGENSDSYRYYKYLNALINYYESAKLVIVSSDVDQSRIVDNTIKK